MADEFKKGELIYVKQPWNKNELTTVCVVVSITIPCYYKLNDFFMVYDIKEKQKFITTKKFMSKIS